MQSNIIIEAFPVITFNRKAVCAHSSVYSLVIVTAFLNESPPTHSRYRELSKSNKFRKYYIVKAPVTAKMYFGTSQIKMVSNEHNSVVWTGLGTLVTPYNTEDII